MFRLLLPILSRYAPHSFAKKYDKEGVYVKHYIPALRNMPAKYVYEPWLARSTYNKKPVASSASTTPVADHAVQQGASTRSPPRTPHKEANTATGKSAKPTRNLVVSAVYIFYSRSSYIFYSRGAPAEHPMHESSSASCRPTSTSSARRSSRETASTRVSTMKSRVTARVSRVVSSPPRARRRHVRARQGDGRRARVAVDVGGRGRVGTRARGRWGRRCDAS